MDLLRSDVARVALEVLSEVLGTKLNLEDDFFGVGGDSLSALEFTARMNASGYVIDEELIFDTPRISDLLARLSDSVPALPNGAGDGVAAPYQVSSVSMTPHQKLCIDTFENLEQQVVSLLLETQCREISELQSAVRATLNSHDAFTTRLDLEGREMQSLNDILSPEILVVDNAGLQSALQACAASITPGLFQPYRTYIIDCQGRLFVYLVAHHMIFDAVSRSLFMTTLARHLAGQRPIRTSSFRAWACALAQHVGADLDRRVEAWAAMEYTGAHQSRVPEDDVEPNRIEDCIRVSQPLEGKLVGLLRALPQKGLAVDAALLACLAQGRAITWGVPPVVDVQRQVHGREKRLYAPADQTLGFLTNLVPNRIAAFGQGLEPVARVTEALNSVPLRGYGPALTDLWTEFPRDILFTNHARFSAPRTQASIQSVPCGPTPQRTGPRRAQFQIHCDLRDSSSQIQINFSPLRIETEAVRAWLRASVSSLLEMLTGDGAFPVDGPAGHVH